MSGGCRVRSGRHAVFIISRDFHAKTSCIATMPESMGIQGLRLCSVRIIYFMCEI